MGGVGWGDMVDFDWRCGMMGWCGCGGVRRLVYYGVDRVGWLVIGGWILRWGVIGWFVRFMGRLVDRV